MRKILLALLFAIVPLAAQAQEPLVKAAWVQYGPDGAVEARAVVDAKICPSLVVDGIEKPMAARAEHDAGFLRVCTAPVRTGARKASVLFNNIGFIIPAPVADPRRIVVFGDTGCRIKGRAVQDCSDAGKWPFPQIATQAAALNPDLVIHVGDYLYREAECPPGYAGCAGTPFGDNWPTWDADFFTPAEPLLSAAPWVFVRGNHEECGRAGAGWMRLLGPLPYDPAEPCSPHLAPYSVPLGALNLVVMDDADAPDQNAADTVPAYRGEIASLADAKTPAWLLLHRPIWAAVRGPFGLPAGGNKTLIAAIGKRGIPSPVELMLSGHIHTFEAINYGPKDHVPPQIVAGFGGDELDPTPLDLEGTIFQGNSRVTVKDGLSVRGFGFLLMTRNGEGWTVEVHDVHGRIERECQFRTGRVDCPNNR